MSVRVRVANYLEKLTRGRALLIACVGLALGLAACSRGARQDPIQEFSTEVAIGPGLQPVVERELAPGAYLVEIVEHEIDLRAVIDQGSKHAELEDQAPRHGEFFKIVSVDQPAQLRVLLRSVDHHSKNGSARLRISRWQRTPAGKPTELELGYQAFGDALEQNALATPDSWARAADKLHESVSHFEVAGDDAAWASAAYALANVQYGGRDAWSATVGASEIAVDAYRASGDETGIQNSETLRAAAELELAAAMNSGAQRAEQRAMYEAADRRLKVAADYFIANKIPVRAEYAVNMRGVRAINVANYEAAAEFLTQAVALARANRDVAEETKSLSNLATVHIFNGNMAQATTEYAALLPMVDRKAQPYLYAALLGNYGFCLISLGEFDGALAAHTEAIQIYTALGEKDERAVGLSALGSLYFRMGDADRALATLRSAIVAQEELSDTTGLASTLRVAANAAAALGDHSAALDYLRKSAHLDSDPNGVARTNVLVAAELRAQGDLRAAEASLSVPLASANAVVRADALEERAQLRLVRMDLEGAVADLRAADRQFAAVGLEFDRIDTNTALSKALLAQRDVAGASAAADEAVAITSRIRAKSGNPEWRAHFLAARYSPFEARIAADLASGGDSDESAIWRAFRTAEKVRARSLADDLAFDARTSLHVDGEDAAMRARLTTLQLRLEARTLRQDADNAGTIELRRSIEETRAELDNSRLRHGGVAANEQTLPADLRELERKLPAETAVLAYFVGDTGAHAWLLSRRPLRHASLVGRETLQRMIEAAIQERRNGAERLTAERALGAQLFGHLLEEVTEKRLLIIADGPLNGVPFAALPVSNSGAELLIDRFVLGYAPSLALAMTPPPPRRARPGKVAVVSDPVYAPDDRRLHLADSATGGVFRGPSPPSPNNLTRLPYSALEAGAVTKQFGTASIIELSGFDATTERVLALPSNDLAVLHFATHALARRDSPEQSALYLTEYAADGRALPGSRLTANDIARAGLRADVVVLSGCATGDGGELRGEGVLGLTYGFLANGSHSVVAALWPIEDASTARFMNEFYRAYRVSGRAADALRTAQMRMRDSAAPGVWSSFVVRANEFP